MIPKAQATGNLTLRQNALAREILVDDEGRARAVSFIDTTDRQGGTGSRQNRGALRRHGRNRRGCC